MKKLSGGEKQRIAIENVDQILVMDDGNYAIDTLQLLNLLARLETTSY